MMPEFEKESLLKLIEESSCHEDLAPFVSLLPFDQMKSTLYNYINHKLNENELIRKEYYNRVNIEELIPEDVISSIILYLPFKDMCKSSIVSKTLYNAYKTSLNHIKLSLIIDSFDEYFWDQTNRTSSKYKQKDEICFSESHNKSQPIFQIKYVKFNTFLENIEMKEFIHRFWKRFNHLNITNTSTDINYFLNAYNLNLTSNLKSLMYLFPFKYKTKEEEESEDQVILYDFGFLNYGQNLEFILIAFQDENTWNIIIDNCPNLHCMIFYIAADLFIEDEDENQENNDKEYHLSQAPNLWSLSVQAIETDIGFTTKLLNSMLSSSPNLYHLCIDIDINISDKTLILPTNNLLSLTFGSEVIFDNQCENIITNKHKNLRYLTFPWFIQNKEMDDHNFILYKILTKYINNNQNNKYYLGITQDSEGFEDSVAELLDDNANDNEDDENIINIFKEFKDILIDRYHCDENKFANLEILTDEQLNDEEKLYAQNLAKHTFGLNECIQIPPENILKWITNKAFKKSDNDHFALFINDLFNSPVIDDLFQENIVL